MDGCVKIYWGGADKVMCVGIANLEALVDHVGQVLRDGRRLVIDLPLPPAPRLDIAWRLALATVGIRM